MPASTLVKRASKRSTKIKEPHIAYTRLDFKTIDTEAKRLADFIEKNFERIADILLEYESFEVVRDETDRTLDLLRNLKENKEYFKLRIGPVTSFLPRNQPLYSLACFVIVPSFMASEVHFRIPRTMRAFLPKLMELLEVGKRFPNVHVSDKQRLEFLRERSALRKNPKTGETAPVTDAVIFTGQPVHANEVRLVFDRRSLFIGNGAGHNPVVVCKDADLTRAADAVLTLQLYNQGQDCAAPNTILVQADIYESFLKTLRGKIANVKVGEYRDRACRVGPLSDPKDLVRIEDFLIENRSWIDPSTPGVISARDGILRPTIVAKPLSEGGNFIEIFGPIVFLQKYQKDDDLALYFEHPSYAPHAMFVTLYGTSAYLKASLNKTFKGKLLHNTHPHAKGVERGIEEYGGYGPGVSVISRNGKSVYKPPLPQREIHEWLVRPLMRKKSLAEYRTRMGKLTALEEKNVEKLLRLNSHKEGPKEVQSGVAYVDTEAIPRDHRYARLDDEMTYRLLDKPAAEYAAKLSSEDRKLISAVRALVIRDPRPAMEAFKTELYAVPKKPDAKEAENKSRQLALFRNLYQLLLGKDSGPRLAQFLLDVERKRAAALLDV